MICSNFQWVHFFIFLVLCSYVLLACDKPAATNDSFDAELVTRQVTEAVNAFYVADTSRNAQAVIALLWPEYTMLADGNRITYKDVKAGSPQFMDNLDVFHTEWTELEIIPISKNAAISSFLFRDSLVSKSGDITKKRGPTTLYWEKREGQWRARYGDADHYPW